MRRHSRLVAAFTSAALVLTGGVVAAESATASEQATARKVRQRTAEQPKPMERGKNLAAHTDRPGGGSAEKAPPRRPSREAHPTEATAPTESAAKALAAKSAHPVEAEDARTESSSVVANPDGTMTLESFSGPVRLRRGGEWVDVDTSLERRGGVVVPRAAKGSIQFSNGGTGDLASITGESRRLAMRWPSGLPTPEIDGDVATYRDVAEGTDLKLQATRSGFLQTIVLRERPKRAPVFRLPLQLSGLDVKVAAGGEIRLVDGRGKVVTQATRPEMWDAAVDARSGEPANMKPVRLEVDRQGKQVVLVLRPDPAFLRDAEYPVTVDPSPSLTAQGDTWVQSNIVNTSQWNSTILKSGTYDGGGTKARSFLKFDARGIVGKKVLSATMSLYNYHSWSCSDRRTYVNPLKSGFSSSTVWSNQPGYDTATGTSADFAYGYSSSCPANYGKFNMVDFATNWAAGAANYGVVVRASETDSYAWKKFHSGNNGSRVPSLVVSYNSYPNTPSSPSPANAATVSTLTPTLSAVVSDADGGDLRATFDLINSAGTPVIPANTAGSLVKSGSRSSYTIPAGKLAWGQTYRWRVRAKDATDYSESYAPSSGYYTFTTKQAIVPPSAPGVDVVPGDTMATVNWTAPADNGGAPITGYELYVYANACTTPPSPTTALKYAAYSATTFTAPVTGLTNGTTYCFMVTATNSAGEGAAGSKLDQPHGLAQLAKRAIGRGPAGAAYAYGDTVRYEVTATNPEPTTSTMEYVVIEDAVPPEMVSAVERIWVGGTACSALPMVDPDPTDPTDEPLPACSLDAGNVTVRLAKLKGGESRAVVYELEIPAASSLGCTEFVNGATVTNSAGARSAPAVKITACNSGLGLEPWWSYHSEDVGPQSNLQVNVATGNAVLQATDATAVQSHGRLGLVLRRTYNSSEATLATLPGTIGAGWVLNVGQSDDLALDGVGTTALYVPNAEALTTPLSVGLIDRDGTRHLFRPNAVSIDTALPVVNAALRPVKLALAAPYTKLCIDQSYTALAGVHLGLWRYAQTTAGSCTELTNGNSQLLGFAAVSPDRIRYEYAATGQLLSMADGAGNQLLYRYDNEPTGVTTGLFNGLTLNLGRLRAVYEKNSCTVASTAPRPLDDAATKPCRAIRFYYPSATEVVVFDAATTPGLATGRGPTRYYLDAPVAGRPQHLIQVTNPDDSANTTSTGSLDPAAPATKPDRLYYRYGGHADCPSSGATADQLCAVRGPRLINGVPVTTKLTYGSKFSGLLGDMPRVTGATNRRGTTTSLVYSATPSPTSSGVTTVDTDPGKGTGTHRRTFSEIDTAGRIGKLTAGDASSSSTNTLGISYFTWDSDERDVSCRLPDQGIDNNLCLVQRVTDTASPPVTPHEETSYTYNAQGGRLSERRCVAVSALTAHTASCPTDPTALVTTAGFDTQYFGSGQQAPTVVPDRVAGSGNVTVGVTAPPEYLFATTDRVESLTARGNDPANQPTFTSYRTSYTVDNVPSAAPSAYVAGQGFCTATGDATRNSGLVCRVDAPGSGAGGRSVTRYTFEEHGQRTTMTSPKAVAEEATPRKTVYTYFADRADLDMAGVGYAGGWLKAVTDPLGQSVVFGYDAAGNVARSWDRDATAGHPLTEWNGTGYVGPAPAPKFAETLYGPYAGAPVGATPFSAPWRYLLHERNQVGSATAYFPDVHGNRTAIRPPRGVAANTDSFDVQQGFDADDRLAASLAPEQRAANKPTRNSYDVFGNLQVTTDPNGHVTSMGYDAKNRLLNVYVARGPAASTEVPTGCYSSASNPAPGIPASPAVVYCRESKAYDLADNVISATDRSAQRTDYRYDGARRRLTTTTPRNHGGLTTLVTQDVYDRDNNVLLHCPPRQRAEGGAGSCVSTSGRFSTHSTFDPAGRVTARSVFRDSAGVTKLTTTFGYDADGNTLRTTAPRPGVVITNTFDLLGRALSTTSPRESTLTLTTSKVYTPSGDVAAVLAPGATTDNPAAVGPQTRITAYRYDAAHRLVDTVSALQVTGDPRPMTAAQFAASALAARTDSAAQTNLRSRVEYDLDGRVVTSFNPRAFVGIDGNGTPNPRFAARYTFDRNGRATSLALPRYDTADGALNDPTGDPVQGQECRTGALGYPTTVGVCVTTLGYDDDGKVVRVDLPSRTTARPNRQLTFGYTYEGLLLSSTAPDPRTDDGTARVRTQLLGYDGSGRVIKQTDAAGRVSTTGYTADGLTATVIAPAGPVAHETRYSYDANGGQTTVTTPRTSGGLPEDLTTTTTYFADGLVQKISAPGSGGTSDWNVTSYSYDLAGNPTAVMSPSANAGDANNTAKLPTSKEFTLDNLVKTIKQPVAADGSRLRLTTHGYDTAGRTVSTRADLVNSTGAVIEAGLTAQQFTYFPTSLPRTEQGRAGKGCISKSYNAAGSLTSAVHSVDAGCAAPTADPQPVSADYYLDELLRHAVSSGESTKLSYDGNGNPTGLTRATAKGAATLATSRYSDGGLPTSMTDTLTSTTPTRWSYDVLGRPTVETLPSGLTHERTFFTDGTLESLKVRAPGETDATLTGKYSYSYDELYRILSQTYEGKDGTPLHARTLPTTYGYAYDRAGRVSSFTNSGLLPSQQTKAATWDHDGNRLSFATKRFTYNADDSIAAGPAGTSDTPRAHGYDPEGRLKSDGCTTTTFDGFDRTKTSTGAGGADCPTGSVTYAYDALDRQTSQLQRVTGQPDMTTSLTYQGLASSVLSERTDGAGARRVDYSRTPSGDAIAASNSVGSVTHYLSSDGTGSIGVATTAAAEVACTARYNPFGEPAGNTPTEPTGSCNTGSTHSGLFYRSGRRDQATGTYQLGARTYDPAKAAFTTPDAYRGGSPGQNLSVGVDPVTANRYTYVNGDPVNLVDPSGHREMHAEDARDETPKMRRASFARMNQAARARSTGRGVTINTKPVAAEFPVDAGNDADHDEAVEIAAEWIDRTSADTDLVFADIPQWLSGGYMVRGGGPHGEDGFPDIVLSDGTFHRIWEVKPATPYGFREGKADVERYLKAMQKEGLLAQAGYAVPPQVRRSRNGGVIVVTSVDDLPSLGMRKRRKPDQHSGVLFYAAFRGPVPTKIQELQKEQEKEAAERAVLEGTGLDQGGRQLVSGAAAVGAAVFIGRLVFGAARCAGTRGSVCTV